MNSIRVRKIVTEASNNVWYLLFEEGEIQNPIKMLSEEQLLQLEQEITHAKQNHNVLRHYNKNKAFVLAR